MCRLHQIFFFLFWTYGYWYRQLRRLDKHCITYYQRCHLMACFYRPLSIPHACQDPIFFQFLRVFTKVEEACQEFNLRSPDFGDHDRWCLGRHRAACVKRYLAVCARVCACVCVCQPSEKSCVQHSMPTSLYGFYFSVVQCGIALT